MSSMCKNQLVAALTSFRYPHNIMGHRFTLISAYGGTIGEISELPVAALNTMTILRAGSSLLKDVIYHLSFTGVCLFATFKSIESSKWR